MADGLPAQLRWSARARSDSKKTNYLGQDPMPRWTPDAHARQAQIVHRWKPWSSSTGPRTSTGKSTVAKNADRGKAAWRREALWLMKLSKYCVRQFDLLQCEGRDLAGAVRTGRFDLFEKKHFACRAHELLPFKLERLNFASLEAFGRELSAQTLAASSNTRGARLPATDE